MNQTPLQFCFKTKGATYGEKGEKSIWTRTTGEGHDNRQCTVQLTYLPMVSLAWNPCWSLRAQDKEFQTEKRGSMIQESWSISKRTRGATRKWRSSGSEICGRSQTCLVNHTTDFLSYSFNWKKHVHVNRRKLYRVFNFNLKAHSCC